MPFIFACQNDQNKNLPETSDGDVQVPSVFSAYTQINVADSLFQKAQEYRAENKTDSAFLLHQKALEIREQVLKNDIKLVDSYRIVASFYLKDFKYETAEKYLENARFIGENVGIDPDHLIDIYFDLSDCKRNMKDFPIAISLLERARDLIRVHFPGDRLLLAKCYHLLGGTYFNDKKYSATIENVKKAIAMIPPGDHRLLADFYTTLGMGYREAKEYEKALHSFNQSIRHDLKWAGPESDPIAIRCINKASVLTTLGKNDSAKFYLLKNLRIRRKIHAEKNVNTFGAKYSLGQFFETLGNYDSALIYYHESLISLIKNFNNKNWRFNPKPFHDEMNTDLIIGLVGKASVLRSLFKKDSTRFDLLQASLATYFLADSVFTAFRKNFIADDPQLVQLEAGYIPYAEMVDITFRLYRHEKNFRFLQDAFTIMEKSRAVLLQNALMRAEAFSEAGVPDELRKREKMLISLRQNILQHLSREGLQNTDSLQKALLAVNDRHNQLVEEINKINPGYSIKYMDDDLQLTSVIDYLKIKNALLIEFLWSDEAIYSLVITKDTVVSRVVDLTPAANAALRQINAEVRAKSTDIYDKKRFIKFCANSNLLYKILIGDLEPMTKAVEETNALIISADGPLQTFPFEVLISDNPGKQQVNYNLPYIFNKYAVSYSLSSTLLLRQSGKRNGDRLIAFAYAATGPDSDGIQKYDHTNLPGTEHEITTIRKILPAANNEFYFAGNASESTFKKRVADFNLVHLALHGVGDTLNALESRLIFRADSNSVEDGKLYAHELYDLDLRHVDLAVLSACESGIGKQQKGEGVISIARSFAYGGCPSQVISLWRVDDRSTAELMENFYRHLAEGDGVNFSLTLAKRDYMVNANEFSSHPAFWAAFIQIGETSPLFTNTIGWKVWLLIVVSALLMLALVIRLRSFYSGIVK